MKQLIQLGVVSSLLIGQSALAINPIQGWYVGVLAGASHGPGSYVSTFDTSEIPFPNIYYPLPNPFPNGLLTGTVNNNNIGGGGGAGLGFRMQNFRVEGELFYNYITTKSFQTGDCTLQKPYLETPIGVCNGVNTLFKSVFAGFNGNTSAIYGLVNTYYDFMSYDSEKYLVPYVGIGIGGVRLTKNYTLSNTLSTISVSVSDTATAAAAQGIVGFSYYLDDYAWLGMDYRYLTTRAITTFNNESKYTLNMININANFSFDNASLN